jgi:hypothetical protein
LRESKGDDGKTGNRGAKQAAQRHGNIVRPAGRGALQKQNDLLRHQKLELPGHAWGKTANRPHPRAPQRPLKAASSGLSRLVLCV